MTKVVYGIGHSNLDWHHFVALLDRNRIDKLIDVRTSPRSRLSWFNSGFLRQTLFEMYEHWPVLGGLQRFEEPTVRRALQQILDRTNGDRVCFMCSEGDYRACHRHLRLTPVLLQLGCSVLQIAKDGTLTEDHGPCPLHARA